MRPVRNIPGAILDESRRILEAFPLCDSCLGRMYVKKLGLASSANLGAQIRSRIASGGAKCYICRDVFSDMGRHVDQMASISDTIHHSSFLVGAILRPSVMDRDDHVRSLFKLRGTDGIKAEITRSLSRSFARRSKRPPDHLDPDLTFLVNFRTGICEWRTKPVVICGRYTKHRRGLPQRQPPCIDCGGAGCIFCNNRGISSFDSVEGVISRMLYEKFGAAQVRFTWVGGEDRDSLVGGRGRPFFARLINPKSRNRRLAKGANLGDISLHGLKKIRQIPRDPTRFQSKIVVYVKSCSKIGTDRLARLHGMTKKPVTMSDGRRPVLRKIHKLWYKRTSPDGFRVRMVADGGIAIKRLVEGGVEPSMSEILGTDCTCVRFDFEDIMTND